MMLMGNFKNYGSMVISKTDKNELSIWVKDFRVEPEQNITLLGFNIDSSLSFSEHISISSQRVGVIMRLRNLNSY